MKKLLRLVLVLCALSGAYTTYHFYSPVRGLTNNGHFVSRAQLVDMLLDDFLKQHMGK